MENKSHAIAAGIFVLVIVGLLGGLAAWLTRDQASYARYELTTTQAVTGLQEQAAVRYKGVTVGKVESIGFDPEMAGRVLIHIGVDRNTPLTANTYARLGYQGVTGLAHIELDNDVRPLPSEGESPDGYPRLPMRPSNLSLIASQGPEVIGSIHDMVARINRLLSDENQRVLLATAEGVGEAARSTTSLIQSLETSWNERLEPALARFTDDDTLQALQSATASLDAMGKAVTDAAQRLSAHGGTLDQLKTMMNQLAGIAEKIDAATLPGITRTLQDIGAAARNVGTLTREISRNPQALIYGPNTSLPGPGEPGYVPPTAAAP